jgi:hypothetical protein
MNCPYCGTENPADAKDCSNCSADLTSLPKSTPPPESTAPTMMSSAAEVAAMLAAKAEQETGGDSEPGLQSEASEEASAFAPTMVSAIPTEVAAAIAAQASEASSEEPADEEPAEEQIAPDLEPLEMEVEVSESEVPSSSFEPTMISTPPEEVAAVIAAVKAQSTGETEKAEPEPEAAAPTMAGIPDPLGIADVEEALPPAFKETPTPFFNEPVEIPPIPEPPSSSPNVSVPSSETPAGDNRRMWIIGGIGGCLVLCCLCSLVVVAVSYLPSLFQ